MGRQRSRIVDDGYRWHKYGAKLVKGAQQYRSYFKCVAPGCQARKKLWKGVDDQEVVVYDGEHTCPGPHMSEPFRQDGVESGGGLSTKSGAGGGSARALAPAGGSARGAKRHQGNPQGASRDIAPRPHLLTMPPGPAGGGPHPAMFMPPLPPAAAAAAAAAAAQYHAQPSSAPGDPHARIILSWHSFAALLRHAPAAHADDVRQALETVYAAASPAETPGADGLRDDAVATADAVAQASERASPAGGDGGEEAKAESERAFVRALDAAVRRIAEVEAELGAAREALGSAAGAAAVGRSIGIGRAAALAAGGAAGTEGGTAEDAAHREAALSRYRDKRERRTFNVVKYAVRKEQAAGRSRGKTGRFVREDEDEGNRDDDDEEGKGEGTEEEEEEDDVVTAEPTRLNTRRRPEAEDVEKGARAKKTAKKTHRK